MRAECTKRPSRCVLLRSRLCSFALRPPSQCIFRARRPVRKFSSGAIVPLALMVLSHTRSHPEMPSVIRARPCGCAPPTWSRGPAWPCGGARRQTPRPPGRGGGPAPPALGRRRLPRPRTRGRQLDPAVMLVAKHHAPPEDGELQRRLRRVVAVFRGHVRWAGGSDARAFAGLPLQLPRELAPRLRPRRPLVLRARLDRPALLQGDGRAATNEAL